MKSPNQRRQLFPCFIAVDAAPPLVIGNAAILQAKIRLLLKFAPLVELVTDVRPVARLGNDKHVRVIEDMPCRQAHDLIPGRPLVILDTADPALNESLSAAARAAGVPVNVPDHPALCSAFLGAIVERAPVLIAISTAGASPVLGQRIRARIESMLPAGFGRLATYLDRRRNDLQGLAPARRRAVQYRIVDGPAADHVIAGDEAAADRQLASLIAADAGMDAAMDPGMDAGWMKIVDTGTGDPGLLSLRGVETIRNADLLVHEAGTSAAITDLARREADLVTVPTGLPGAWTPGPVDRVAALVADALARGQLVVLLLPRISSVMMMLVGRLAANGLDGAVIPAAMPDDGADTGALCAALRAGGQP